MNNQKSVIKIWGNKKDKDIDNKNIDIWNQVPSNFITSIEKEKYHKPSIKDKHWGSRYALYGFILSVILQLVVVLTFTGIETARLTNNGISPDKVESEALKAIKELGPALLTAQLAMYAGWILTMLYVTYRKGLHSFAKDFWLRFKWRQDVILGVFIAIGLRFAELAMFTLLQAFGVSLEGADNSSQWQGNTLWAYFFMFVIVSFVGPFCEELFFRGLLLQGLIRTFRRKSLVPRTWFGDKVQKTYPPFWYAFSNYKNFLYKYKYFLAIMISAVAFGFMHFQGTENFGQWLVVIETGLVGAVFAYMTIKTQRLGTAIVAHIVFNFSGMFVSLFV